MSLPKVIIWGHKSPKHTHHHIHYGYFKAFKFLGYDTFWFDKEDNISNFCFNDSIFLTEDQAHQGIPLLKKAKYILHHCILDKYIESNCKFINLQNYLNIFSNQYLDNKNRMQKINPYTFFDENSSSLIQPWATDLLPHEFSNEIFPLNASQDSINYIGTVWGPNELLINEFNDACKNHRKKFMNFTSFGVEWREGEFLLAKNLRKATKKIQDFMWPNPINETVARKLTVESYIAPDIRNKDHVDRGYIPCRIFKNISYGKIPGTNSFEVSKFFVNPLPYSTDMHELFELNASLLSNSSKIKNFYEIHEDVKKKHTYINRIEEILKCF